MRLCPAHADVGELLSRSRGWCAGSGALVSSRLLPAHAEGRQFGVAFRAQHRGPAAVVVHERPSFTATFTPGLLPSLPAMIVSTCLRGAFRWPSRAGNWCVAARLAAHRSLCARRTGCAATSSGASGSRPRTLSSNHCCAAAAGTHHGALCARPRSEVFALHDHLAWLLRQDTAGLDVRVRAPEDPLPPDCDVVHRPGMLASSGPSWCRSCSFPTS